mgnify:CR=1 FL=1
MDYSLRVNRKTIAETRHPNRNRQFEIFNESIKIWLDEFGWKRYPDAKELLILCDAGGSNGFRPRLWKYALYQNINKKMPNYFWTVP